MCREQGCTRLMSRESNLTRLWLKWVESELSRPWKSRIWVESESNHIDRPLSQSWVKWILLESKMSHWFFWRENVNILDLSVDLQEKSNLQLHSYIHTPPPRSTTFGQIRWNMMSRESDLTQLWLKSVESELSQASKLGIWVESELSQVSKF